MTYLKIPIYASYSPSQIKCLVDTAKLRHLPIPLIPFVVDPRSVTVYTVPEFLEPDRRTECWHTFPVEHGQYLEEK
jgi:hypothetical protein